MTFKIKDETIAYVAPAETTWKVALRDGTGLQQGLYTVTTRNYYDTPQAAHEAAQRFVENDRADRVALNVVAKRVLDK